jgi:carboxymethylenebutenolidase
VTAHRIFLTGLFVAGCASNTANVDTARGPASDAAEPAQTQPASTREVASGLTCEPTSGLCTEAEFASAARGGTAVDGRWVDLAEGRGFLVMPTTGQAPVPAVLLLHTALGLNEETKLAAARLGAHGVVVLAIDLYDGKVAKTADEVPALRDAANQRAEENMATITAGVDFLRSNASVQATSVALVGFSYGGAWATYLVSNLDVVGAVSYAGEAFGPENPVAKLQRPVLLITGDQDEQVSAARIDELQSGAAGAGAPLEVVVVPGAHGLQDPTREAYDPSGAERAFSSMIQFLSEVLLARARAQ